MKRILTFVLGLGLIASLVGAELNFRQVSATSTSFTAPLNFAGPVTICNAGANTAYFRLFFENETAAAATTSNAPIAAGVCIEFPKKSPFYSAASFVTSGADTATINIYFFSD